MPIMEICHTPMEERSGDCGDMPHTSHSVMCRFVEGGGCVMLNNRCSRDLGGQRVSVQALYRLKGHRTLGAEARRSF